MRHWQERHPEKIRQTGLNFSRTPAGLEANWRRKGIPITFESYLKLLELQDGVCVICNEPPGRIRLAVDHDHSTGKVRGLVHSDCNLAIGCFERMKDREKGLRQMKDYLDKHLDKLRKI